MRIVLSVCLLACVFAGCEQRRPQVYSSATDSVAKANAEASKISMQRGWKVTKKEIFTDDPGLRDGIRLTLDLGEKQLDPRSGLRVDIVTIDIYKTHRFFKEFDALDVGSITTLHHMPEMDDRNMGKPSTFLAPHCPVVSEYYKQHVDGGY